MSTNDTRNDRHKTGSVPGLPELVRKGKIPALPSFSDQDPLLPTPPANSWSVNPMDDADYEFELDTTNSPVSLEPSEKEFYPGEFIGHFRLVRLLSKRGMTGEVWQVCDESLGDRCVIKIFRPRKFDPAFYKRFHHEARVTASLKHANIVAVRAKGIYKAFPYIVFEFLKGKTLSEIMTDKPMSPGHALALVWTVLEVLQFAHSQQVVHRDLKPSNIFVTEEGRVVVIDFGVAKVLNRPAPIEYIKKKHPSVRDPQSVYTTDDGVVVGTIAYMSPEQMTNGPVDGRSDLFSFGVMLFCMLAGHRPYKNADAQQLKIVADWDIPMPRLIDAVSNIDPRLDQIVAKCLEKDRNKRYSNVSELMADLEPFKTSPSVHRKIPDDRCPWPGLVPYEEVDADRFCGRDNEILATCQKIRECPLLGLFGPPGMGKSSHIRGGVIPNLQSCAEGWVPLIIRPGRHPMDALISAVMALIEPHSSATLAKDLEKNQTIKDRLKKEPGVLAAAIRKHAHKQGIIVLVFIDQLEEIFTLANTEEMRMFLICISSIAYDSTAPARVVIAMRSDFLDRLNIEAPYIMREMSLGGMFFVRLPDREGLQKAILQPASLAGYQFENPGMVEELLDDLEGSPAALSLIQTAMQAMWEKRDPANKLLTKKSYDEIGGILGALNTHADRVFNELSVPAQAIARNVFQRLITPEGTRAGVPIDELLEISQQVVEVNQVIEHLVKARLLLIYRPDKSFEKVPIVELAHDSLVSNWNTLRRWLEEDQEAIRFLGELSNAAKQWENKKRSAHYLWRDDEMISEATSFRNRYKGELSASQSAYLDQVIYASAKTAQRKRMVQIGALGVLTAFALTCAIGIAIIWKSETKALESARKAQQAQAVLAHQHAQREAKSARKAENKAQNALQELEQVAALLRIKNKQLAKAWKWEAIARHQANRNYQEATMARQEAELAVQRLEKLLQIELIRNRELKESFVEVTIRSIREFLGRK